jgi:hypothetical protein
MPVNPFSTDELAPSWARAVTLLKGGPGSGAQPGHGFNGNQYSGGGGGKLSGEEQDARRASASLEDARSSAALSESHFRQNLEMIHQLPDHRGSARQSKSQWTDSLLDTTAHLAEDAMKDHQAVADKTSDPSEKAQAEAKVAELKPYADDIANHENVVPYLN